MSRLVEAAEGFSRSESWHNPRQRDGQQFCQDDFKRFREIDFDFFHDFDERDADCG